MKFLKKTFINLDNMENAMNAITDSILDAPNWREQYPHLASLVRFSQDNGFGEMYFAEDDGASLRAADFIWGQYW